MTEPTDEARAKEMGWLPKEEYRGQAEWVDADTYLKRGESMMPFLRANLRRSEEQTRTLNQKLEEQGRLLRANEAALQELREVNNERTRETAEQSVDDLVQGIKDARATNDVDKELELQGRLDDTRAKLREAKGKPNTDGTVTTRPDAGVAPPGATGEDFTQRQEWKDFSAANPDIVNDPIAIATANAVMIQMIAKGEITAEMTPQSRWQKVADATKKRLGIVDNPRREAPSRVEGSRPSGEGSSDRSGGGKGFSDLPQQAKDACDRQAKDSRLVGPGKRYKDVAAYRAYYVGKFFEGEV
jgi:hypothetical protein